MLEGRVRKHLICLNRIVQILPSDRRERWKAAERVLVSLTLALPWYYLCRQLGELKRVVQPIVRHLPLVLTKSLYRMNIIFTSFL